MKKKILLSIVPIIAISSPILIASSCDNVIKDDFFEKRAKETDEEIEKRYINEYIQKENYIFDDFEQFKFDKERHFEFYYTDNTMYMKRSKLNEEKYFLFDDFKKWHDDFIRHYEIFKKVINKYAPEKRKKYENNILNINGYQYYVKEIVFNFNLFNNQNATWSFVVTKMIAQEMLRKILELPNLKLDIALYGNRLDDIISYTLYIGRYFSNLSITTNFLDTERYPKNSHYWTNGSYDNFMNFFSIPKPKLSSDMNDLDGKYKNVNSNIFIKCGRYLNNNTAWGTYQPSHNFYKQFVTQNSSQKYDIQDNVKKYTYNADTIDYFSSIIEVIKYKNNVENKIIDTHFKFRAEKNNEDLKVFKWEGETV